MTGVRYIRKTVFALLGLAIAIGLWELYKLWGPPRGGSLFGMPIFARSSNGSMPHVTSVLAAFGQQEVGGSVIAKGGSTRTVFDSVVSSAGHSLRWAAVGFAVGVVVGLLLALIMDSLRVL